MLELRKVLSELLKSIRHQKLIMSLNIYNHILRFTAMLSSTSDMQSQFLVAHSVQAGFRSFQPFIFADAVSQFTDSVHEPSDVERVHISVHTGEMFPVLLTQEKLQSQRRESLVFFHNDTLLL